MSSELSDEFLGQIAQQVLTDTAFIFSEPADEVIPWEGDVVKTSLEFKSPQKGTLSVTAPRQLGIELAQNLLGMDPEEVSQDSSTAEDALCEIVNILAGMLLHRVYGEEVVCDLGIPQCQKASAGSEEDDDRFHWSLVVDEVGRVDVEVKLEDNEV